MSSRFINAMMSIMLLLFLVQPDIASAADEASFTITVDHNNPKVGEDLTLVIHGEHLQDVFGYELNIAFPSDLLQFNTASSVLGNGFAVPAIVKEGMITYAFTKVGASTAAINGAADLATLKFTTLKPGRDQIKLERIKTVNKSGTASEILPSVNMHIDVKVGAAFTDITEGYWANEAIARAVALGFVNGYPDGTFRPLNVVTRAEYVTMLARAMQVTDDNEKATIRFKDDNLIGGWASPYISKAVSEGWIRGFEDETFRPNLPVTRTEMTAIAVRVLKLNTETTGAVTFTDVNSIPRWAQASVAAAAAAGIVKGRDNNRFYPAMPANRAEAVMMILRVLDYGKVE